MKLPHGSYETLSQAMNELKEKGFTYDFDFKDGVLCCSSEAGKYDSKDLKIVEIHRFI